MAATQLTPTEQAQWGNTKQPALYGSMSVFLALANTAFFARLFCQLKVIKAFQVDDVFLALALAQADTIIALFLLATHNGFGLHIFRVLAQDPHPPQRVVTLFKYIFVTSVLQVACLASIKLSLLFLYRRVFVIQQRWQKIVWWGNLVYVILWFFGAFFFFIFQCAPPSFYWTRFYSMAAPSSALSAPHGSCDPATSGAVTAILILSLMSDVGLLILPVGTVATLQLTRRKILTLECVFGLGVIAVGVSIGRIISIKQVGNDPTYNIVTFMILTSAEQITAIVCACGPIVIPTLIKYLRRKKAMGTTSSTAGILQMYSTCCHRLKHPRGDPRDDTIKLSNEGSAEFIGEFEERQPPIGDASQPQQQIKVTTEVCIHA